MFERTIPSSWGDDHARVVVEFAEQAAAQPPSFLSSVCHLELINRDQKSTFATGVLINPHTVLTAGHCLRAHGRWVKEVRVTPHGQDEPVSSLHFRVAARWEQAEEGDADCGVVVVEFPNGPIPYVGMLSATDEMLEDAPIVVAGFLSEQREPVQHRSIIESSRQRLRFRFRAGSDIGGFSGAPVLRLHKGEFSVVGLVTGSEPSLTESQGRDVVALRITQEILDLATGKGLKEAPATWICVAGTGKHKLLAEELEAAQLVGRLVADLSFGLITGGWPGVDYVAAEAFWQRMAERSVSSPEQHLLHIVPEDRKPEFRPGTVRRVPVDADYYAESLRSSNAIILIGGLGGTGKLGDMALQKGLPVLPLQGTGRDANRLHQQILEQWEGKRPLSITLEEFLRATERGKEQSESLRSLLERIGAGESMSPKAPRVFLDFTNEMRIDREIAIDDPPAQFGPRVTSRQQQTLSPGPAFRMGKYLVRNRDFYEFVLDGGYNNAALWNSKAPVDSFICEDGVNHGPASWQSGRPPLEKEDHPVSQVCYYEAEAFCRWLNFARSQPGWEWRLPTEDEWEYVVRVRSGPATMYPWGNEFRPGHCNCICEGRHETSPVGEFAAGNSPDGCADLAGNVWEFVDSTVTAGSEETCVLRGGSYKNNEHEVQSMLRLLGVPAHYRAVDFGFRCTLAQRNVAPLKR